MDRGYGGIAGDGLAVRAGVAKFCTDRALCACVRAVARASRLLAI